MLAAQPRAAQPGRHRRGDVVAGGADDSGADPVRVLGDAHDHTKADEVIPSAFLLAPFLPARLCKNLSRRLRLKNRLVLAAFGALALFVAQMAAQGTPPAAPAPAGAPQTPPAPGAPAGWPRGRRRGWTGSRRRRRRPCAGDVPGRTASAGRSGDHRQGQGAVRHQLPELPRRGPARRRHGRTQPPAIAGAPERPGRRARPADRPRFASGRRHGSDQHH